MSKSVASVSCASTASSPSAGRQLTSSDHQQSSSEKHSDKMSEEERRIAGFSDIFLLSKSPVHPHYRVHITISLSIILLDLGMILAGVVFGWNKYMAIGVGEYLISLGLCTLGYVCLALCVAEMAGIIAFSGGSFGYARCTLSPFIGYLVGMCDLLQCVFYTATVVYIISDALSISVSGEDHFLDYLPLWWFAIYAVMILIALPGGRMLWNSIIAFVVLTIIMMLLYVLGCAPLTNFRHYATEQGIGAFAGTTHDFMNNLIVPTACYIGVDLVTVFGDEVKRPEYNIPYAMLAALFVTIIFAWWVTLTVVSIDPGVSLELMGHKILFPMHFGFEQIFNTTDAMANFLMAPTMFSSAIGFMFASSRQMYSMSKSGLLPSCLSITFGDRKTPVTAMITSAVLGIIVLLPVWGFEPQADDLYELCIVGACFVYISMFWCYIVFTLHYSSMDRTFRNPLGIASAIYGIIYFLLVLATLLFAQLDFNALCAFVPYMILAIVYYYRVAESRQFFSKEEQKKFMKAYILNANRRKKQKTGPVMQFFLKVFNTVSMASLRRSKKSGRSVATGSRAGSMSGHTTNAGHRHGQMNHQRDGSFSVGSVSVMSGMSSIDGSIAEGASKSAADSAVNAAKEAAILAGSSNTTTPAISVQSQSTMVVDSKDNEQSRPVETTSGQLLLHKDDVIVGNNGGSASGSPSRKNNKITPIVEENVVVLPSLASNSQGEVLDTIQWSGKVMDEAQSRKFFEILHVVSVIDDAEGANTMRSSRKFGGNIEEGLGFGADTISDDNLVDVDVEEDLLRELPDLFIRPGMTSPANGVTAPLNK